MAKIYDSTGKAMLDMAAVDKQAADILLLDERKADIEGSYESMTVGNAKALEDNTLTAVDFTKRVVPSSVGSGIAKLSLLKGNTLVWNQIVTFGDSVTEEVVNGVTWSYDSGTGLFTFQGTCTETSSFETNLYSYHIDDFEIVAGHKYLLFNTNRDGDNTPTLSIRVGDAGNPNTIYVPNNYDLRNTIITASGSSSSSAKDYYLCIYFKAGETYNGSCYFNIFDLTRMFGAGNEPSSVEEFEALFPHENYSSSNIRLVNFTCTQLKSTGSNFEQTFPLNVTTLKGKAEGSDTEVVMFPDGLKKAGSVYDEIDFANGIAIKRVGSVDLGRLDYTTVTLVGGKKVFSTGTQITDGYHSGSVGGRAAGLTCTKYAAYGTIVSGILFDIGDKLMWQQYDSSALRILIHDSSYTDAAAFKIAMQDEFVTLHYELDTPIVYHFEPMNNVYRVEQGGTEEVEPMGSGGLDGYWLNSSPMKADIRYSVDVVGILENLKSDIGDIGTILDQLNGE